MAQSFVTGVSSKYGAAKSAGNSVRDGAVNVIKITPNLNSTGASLGQSFVTGVNSKTSGAKTAGANVRNSATNGMSNYGTTPYTTGQNIGQGLINGLSSKAKDAYNTAYYLAQQVVNKLKNGAEVASPSKATRRIGRFISEGLALGINDEANKAIAAAKSVAEKTTAAIAPSLSIGTSYGTSRGIGGANKANTITQNNYFTQKNLSPFEVLQEQRKLNKQLVGVFI